MRRTLLTLSRIIQAQRPDWYVSCERWRTSTDRQIGRLRWPGKGRAGYRLTVSESLQDNLVGGHLFRHESGETYRRNAEVVEWMTRQGITLDTPGER